MTEQTNLKTALGWWVVAGAIGVLLRYQLMYPTAILSYPFLLHAHSHVVLLGWTFNALFLAVSAAFVSPERASGYRWLWRGFQMAVFGMLVFFPIQGYAAGSIAFSTLHVFVSYAMVWRIWRDIHLDRTVSARLLRWGLFFLVLSTLGPYVVGALKAKHLQDTIWYPLSVYFYLHFLYNGWFVFGCMALLFRWLEGWGLLPPKQAVNRFVDAFVIACMGTLSLSALWTDPARWVWLVAGVSAVLQLLAGGWLLVWLRHNRLILRSNLNPKVYTLIQLTCFSFSIKLTLQLLSALPWVAEWAYVQRHLVIAYLHLVFVGVVSFYLLAWALQHQRISWSEVGFGTIVFFFVLTESGLVAESLYQKLGSYMPYFGECMLVISFGLWIGVLLLWLRQIRAQS